MLRSKTKHGWRDHIGSFKRRAARGDVAAMTDLGLTLIEGIQDRSGRSPVRRLCSRFLFASLALFPMPMSQSIAGASSENAAPIHLRVTTIQFRPVTAIKVGKRTVQAIVDTGGGAFQLSKEILDSVDAVRLENSVASTNASGQEFEQRRYRAPRHDRRSHVS